MALAGGHGELFVQSYGGDPIAPLDVLRSLAPEAAAALVRAELVVGSGAEALVAARGHGRWSAALPRAADAGRLPAAAAQPSAPADLRPRARCEADDMSAPAIRFCDGGIADLDGVMAVMDDSFDPRFGEAWTASQCAGLLPMPGVWLSLALEDETVVGFALARTVAGEAELLLLAVRGGRQRRGIGTMLLDHFAASARARGAARLHLEVREGNHALSLYERAGYTLVGRRKDYYSGRGGRSYDALTLAKSGRR